MNNFSVQLKELSNKQRLLGNTIFWVLVASFVLFVTVYAVILPSQIFVVLLPSFLMTCGILFLAVGFVQINTVLMWTGWFVGSIAVVVLLHTVGLVSLGYTYAIFTGAFVVASVLTLPFSVSKRMHVFVIVAASVATVLLLINGIWSIGLYVVLPVFFVWVLGAFYLAYKRGRNV